MEHLNELKPEDVADLKKATATLKEIKRLLRHPKELQKRRNALTGSKPKATKTTRGARGS